MAAECPVCLEQYDLKDRLPKTLGCHHNVCDKCLTQLRRGDNITCPECRQHSRTQDVSTNFGMKNMLEQHCRVCVKKKHVGECHHCGELLCGTCLDTHRDTSYNEVKGKVQTIIKEWKTAHDKAADEAALDAVFTTERDTIELVNVLVQRQKDGLDRLHAKLVREIKQFSAANVNKYKEWESSLNSQIDECRSFTRTTKAQLGTTCSTEHTTELLADLNSEANDLLSKLHDTQNNLPKMNQYFFIPPESTTLSVGEVACDSVGEVEYGSVGVVVCDSVGEVVCDSVGEVVYEQARVADYTSVRSKAVSGKQGSGVSEVKDRVRVCATDDRIVVADYDNHCVKVYDWELKAMCVIGEKGSGRAQFNHPAGVCCIDGEFYISDEFNNRIQVYNRECTLVRVFGSRGSVDGQFDCPLGLAAGPGPLLYVCDGLNYRVQVVRPDGGYVRNIGCQGMGPGQFSEPTQHVAVTAHGVVLVIDAKHANVYMFKTSGEYLRMLIDTIPHTGNTLNLAGITVDRDDNIILAGYNNQCLIVLDREGQYKCQVGVCGSQPGELDRPWDVSVSRGGDLVVYEVGNSRLQVFGV